MATTGAYGSGNVNIGATAANVFRPKHIWDKMYSYIDNSL